MNKQSEMTTLRRGENNSEAKTFKKEVVEGVRTWTWVSKIFVNNKFGDTCQRQQQHRHIHNSYLMPSANNEQFHNNVFLSECCFYGNAAWWEY